MVIVPSVVSIFTLSLKDGFYINNLNQITFETIMSVYEIQALDPHVDRERFRGEWFE